MRLPMKSRRTRYVIVIIEDGKQTRTNWIGAYKVDHLNMNLTLESGKYTTTTKYDIAKSALALAQSCFPHADYRIKTA